jgi:hypothetical protein
MGGSRNGQQLIAASQNKIEAEREMPRAVQEIRFDRGRQ